MPENGIRNRYSQAPFQIFMNDEQGLISTGSGFFYEYKNSCFLITNWHNISGRHFLTKAPLPGNRFPTHIELKLSTYINEDTPRGFTAITHRLDIYKDFEPIWFEHPELGSTCDVIAIEVKKPDDCPDFMHVPVNLISKIRVPVKPGNSAFVIGFPRSISIGFGLPLWKSGYVASEPYYGINTGGKPSAIGGLSGGINLPAFFIDTLTREGMSGSPVFCSYIGTWDVGDPYCEVDVSAQGFWGRGDIAFAENRMEFIGCYSGRIGREEDGAALGLCWGVDVINTICSSRKLGKHPHISSGEFG